MKGTMYKVLVRRAMMCGMKTVTFIKTQREVLEEAEMILLRFSLKIISLDKIKNKVTYGTMHKRQL